MKTKKVVDWIKFNNLKEQTRNYTALKGLGRVTKITKMLLKITIGGLLVYFPLVGFLNDVESVLKNEPKNFFKRLYALPNREKIFHSAHYNSIIGYAKDDIFETKEVELGIHDYRKKLLKNANGLVLETCKNYFI
jgi:hypothetical protein